MRAIATGMRQTSNHDLGSRRPWCGPDAAAHALADPDFVVPGLGTRCRPVAVEGPVVEAERRRLDALFAMRLAVPSFWPSGSDVALGL